MSNSEQKTQSVSLGPLRDSSILEFGAHLQIGDWEFERALRGFRNHKIGLAPENTCLASSSLEGPLQDIPDEFRIGQPLSLNRPGHSRLGRDIGIGVYFNHI